jgi:hypothetical protein
MKEFLSYLKGNYKGLIISAVFLLWIEKFKLTLWLLAILLFNIATGYNHYRKAKEQEKRLKAKGLTPEDAENIAFVKEWEETRQSAIWQYCVKDGAIISGSFISLITSAISYWALTKLGFSPWAEPGDMFRFIGLNFLAGALIGSIICRFQWNINESRFLRLTDPLNLHFSTVKKLL